MYRLQHLLCKVRKEVPSVYQLSPMTRSMDGADLIILASPVYVYHATGAMKAFLDHYGWRWMVHRPEEKMFQKQAVCISTAAGAGMRSTNQDMAHSTFGKAKGGRRKSVHGNDQKDTASRSCLRCPLFVREFGFPLHLNQLILPGAQTYLFCVLQAAAPL